MPCYLARPKAEEARPAVVVLQEIFGVNAEIKCITEMLAEAGYVALAPNYYHRTDPELDEPYSPEGLERGFAVAAGVSKATLRQDVRAAIEWLNAQPFVQRGKIASWGFCFGGAVAFLTATLEGLRGAICFYGGSIASPMPNGEPEALADAAQIKIPLLLAFGGQDDYITEEHRARIERTLRSLHVDFELKVYPDVGHAFFRQSRAALAKPEIADAWQRVQRFLEKIFA